MGVLVGVLVSERVCPYPYPKEKVSSIDVQICCLIVFFFFFGERVVFECSFSLLNVVSIDAFSLTMFDRWMFSFGPELQIFRNANFWLKKYSCELLFEFESNFFENFWHFERVFSLEPLRAKRAWKLCRREYKEGSVDRRLDFVWSSSPRWSVCDFRVFFSLV